MTQPAVAVLPGWLGFDQALTEWDGFGIVLVRARVVPARAEVGPKFQGRTASG